MVARFLHMDAETWDRQPYWAQRIYLEGLEIERPWTIKLSENPQEWWSPLDKSWENFGEIEPLNNEPQDDAGNSVNESNDARFVDTRGFSPNTESSDITAFGGKITYVNAEGEVIKQT